jgi:hypothetical protein
MIRRRSIAELCFIPVEEVAVHVGEPLAVALHGQELWLDGVEELATGKTYPSSGNLAMEFPCYQTVQR